MSVRWLFSHLVREYAGHVGPADLLRQRIDGATFTSGGSTVPSGPTSDVTGVDPRSTFRDWALERGVAGRSLRLGLLGPLALGAIALGSLVAIVEQVVAWNVPDATHTPQPVLFAALISAAITSMVLAPLSCWAALHRGGDPRASSTARWMLPCLPAGAMIALGLSVLTAAIGGYHGEIVIPIIAVVIALVFLGATTAARFLAIRYTRAAD